MAHNRFFISPKDTREFETGLRASFLCLLLIPGLLQAPPLHAQGPPIHTDSAIISGFEGAAVRSFLHSVQKSGIEGGSAVDISVSMLPVMIPYEIVPNKIIVAGMIPYIRKERSVKNGPAESISGFGDISLVAKYKFLQEDGFKETTRMTLVGGLKLPTGEDDKVGTFSQLGSGSVDSTVGTTLTAIYDRLGLHGDLLYTLNTEANGFKFGDTLKYDLAVGFRLFPAVYKIYPAKQVNLYLELNGLYSKRVEKNGAAVADSGGNTVFLSPGIQFVPGRTVLLEASVQIPIIEDLNGVQPTTDHSFNVGFRWLIL